MNEVQTFNELLEFSRAPLNLVNIVYVRCSDNTLSLIESNADIKLKEKIGDYYTFWSPSKNIVKELKTLCKQHGVRPRIFVRNKLVRRDVMDLNPDFLQHLLMRYSQLTMHHINDSGLREFINLDDYELQNIVNRHLISAIERFDPAANSKSKIMPLSFEEFWGNHCKNFIPELSRPVRAYG